jgi:hypothetical protein
MSVSQDINNEKSDEKHLVTINHNTGLYGPQFQRLF